MYFFFSIIETRINKFKNTIKTKNSIKIEYSENNY